MSASLPLAERPTDEAHPALVYGHNVFVIWTVADSSWFHDLVYGRVREVITRYALVGGPKAVLASPDITVDARFPNPAWSAGVPSRAALEEMFAPALTTTAPTQPFADTELSLAPLAAAAADDYVPPGCPHDQLVALEAGVRAAHGVGEGQKRSLESNLRMADRLIKAKDRRKARARLAAFVGSAHALASIPKRWTEAAARLSASLEDHRIHPSP